MDPKTVAKLEAKIEASRGRGYREDEPQAAAVVAVAAHVSNDGESRCRRV